MPKKMATPAPEDFEAHLRAMLADVARSYMPFGRFGPAQHPPRGVPVWALPYEYLCYFERNGYPRGRLGQVLKFVHDIKRDGAEDIFMPLRQAQGGGVSLRQSRRPPRITGAETAEDDPDAR